MFRRSGCPISVSLEIFGDRSSLLVVRDLMFEGLRTFTEFAAAGEGIATNILAERLERLEGAGIIARATDPADGRRMVYHLTDKGMALAAVLIEMVIWAARYEETEAPPRTVRAMRRDRAAFIAGLERMQSADSTGAERDHRTADVCAARARHSGVDTPALDAMKSPGSGGWGVTRGNAIWKASRGTA